MNPFLQAAHNALHTPHPTTTERVALLILRTPQLKSSCAEALLPEGLAQDLQALRADLTNPDTAASVRAEIGKILCSR